ncbi:MAG: helix-turn-helix transcriptional regulator [Planctomycetota bacterium]
MLGLSLRTVRTLDSAGKLPRALKIGRSVRWHVAEIERWLAAGTPDRRAWESLKKTI